MAATTPAAANQEFIGHQVAAYGKVRPRYEQCAVTLRQILEQAGRKRAPLCIVEARAKAISSFAGKIQRQALTDPVNQFTDLCGARVIVHTYEEIKAICRFIEESFLIDRENSGDVSQRLKPDTFGYRSFHYIVQFKKDAFTTGDVQVQVPAEILPDAECPMKAEIQVRTLLEHAWADFSHDRSYKSSFVLPAKWQREIAAMAALLEQADQGFSRIDRGLKAYEADYGNYMTPEKMREEMKISRNILMYDPKNQQVAHRLGRLAMTLGDWTTARDTFEKYLPTGYAPIVRDLGETLYRMYRLQPDSPGYRKAQDLFEQACKLNPDDVESHIGLARTWHRLGKHDEALRLYQKAFDIDPTHPHALSCYLTCRIVADRNLSSLSLVAPTIKASMKRCEDYIVVGMNMPWSYASLGWFHLLLGQSHESLAAYAKFIQLCTNGWMLISVLDSLKEIEHLAARIEGHGWAYRLMLIGLKARFPKDCLPPWNEELDKMASGQPFMPANQARVPGPVGLPDAGAPPIVMVVGGCDSQHQSEMESYRSLLKNSFGGFRGIIVSGGTTAGVCGLVGEIAAASGGRITAVSYLPEELPDDVTVDPRYHLVCRTPSKKAFTPLEPLQSWIDLVASGVKPAEVRVLGINGGLISALEYRIALALGAQTGVIADSGREAAKLLADDAWRSLQSLVELPAEPFTIQAFVIRAGTRLEEPTRTELGYEIHAAYEELLREKALRQRPSREAFDKTDLGMKESNFQQADHIFPKLDRIGCDVYVAAGHPPVNFTFDEEEVELMAKMEHGRWNVERLLAGWKYGPKKDVANKISPYLVKWDDLDAPTREFDLNTVRKIPEYLAARGLEIHRRKQPQKIYRPGGA